MSEDGRGGVDDDPTGDDESSPRERAGRLATRLRFLRTHER